MPLFFFSCDGDDVDDALLEFFQDLNHAVAQQAGIKENAAGFIFRDGRTVGTDWPTSAGRALAECRVFVPAYTPRFMRSANCGREYFAFRERLKSAGLGWERILPIWWVPVPDGLPEAVRHVVDSRQLKSIADHAQFGMRLVFEQRKNSNAAYPVLLSNLAQMIVQRGNASPALSHASSVNLATGPSIFDEPAEQAPVVASPGGPRRVHFLVLAGTNTEMGSVVKRTQLDYYGEERDMWNPFHPSSDRPLTICVSRIALDNNLYSDIDRLPDDSISFIAKLEERRELVVILADSWATHIDSLAAVLKGYDARRFQNTAIVVPFPADDNETSSCELDLRNALFACIPRIMLGEPTLYREDSRTLDEFLEIIEQVLHELQRRLISQAPPVRRSFLGGKAKMPVLTAPWSPR